MDDPIIRNNTIVYEIGNVRARVVLSDVSRVEVRQLSVAKTIGIMIAVPVGAVVYFVSVCAECLRGY